MASPDRKLSFNSPKYAGMMYGEKYDAFMLDAAKDAARTGNVSFIDNVSPNLQPRQTLSLLRKALKVRIRQNRKAAASIPSASYAFLKQADEEQVQLDRLEQPTRIRSAKKSLSRRSA